MNLIESYIELLEVNKIIQGLAKRSGKPADHINSIWKDTEKELVSKHQYGVTDKYKAIGKIVHDKLGLKADPVDPEQPESED